MIDSVLLYIDPGTGSMIFQMLIAGFLAVVFYFKLAKNWVGEKFRALTSKKKTDGN